ncbi:Serine/threonine-protein kinase stk11 [Rhizoclosmatium hyalinum]|nr:Serine/threonine-protein kinase stk11 [Rhizoclosmatium hyalinum]
MDSKQSVRTKPAGAATPKEKGGDQTEPSPEVSPSGSLPPSRLMSTNLITTEASPKGSILIDKTGEVRKSRSVMKTVSLKGETDEKTTPPQTASGGQQIAGSTASIPVSKKVVARSVSVKSDLGVLTGPVLASPQGSAELSGQAQPVKVPIITSISKGAASTATGTSSLTSSRKSMPQMAKVNFGDEEDEDTDSFQEHNFPSKNAAPFAGRSVSVKNPVTKSKLNSSRNNDDDESDDEQHHYMSTASLVRKKVSQQGKVALRATIRKSMGEGLHENQPTHQSAPVFKDPRISVKSMGAVPYNSQDGDRVSQTSYRESGEKPVIHMFPRKSVVSSQPNNYSHHQIPRSVSAQHSTGIRGILVPGADDEMPDFETVKSKIQASKTSMTAGGVPAYTGSPPKSVNDISGNGGGSSRREATPQHSKREDDDEEMQQQQLRPTLREENPDYYDYVMLSQRHASSNFITKLGSQDIDYGTPETIVKIIGPYVMGEQIGKGAYGKVKEGLCSETLQRVAIKIINKKRLRKIPNGVENALSEIKLLRKMKHRNVITLIDVYCKVEDDEGNVGIFNWFSTIEDEPITWTYDDGSVADKKVTVLKWYLVFEYCPCSLQTLLEQSDGRKISVFRAHKFFVQLIDGLAYLHSQSIIHRDIKAGNLLVTPDGSIKISDFGVTEQFSMYQSKEMLSELFAGTHQFMSPEICEGNAGFEAVKVDIWACGVTLYNMLTGKYPFEFPEDGNVLGLYEKIQAGEFEMPTGLEPDLEDLLKGLLCKDQKKRLNATQVQKHAWYRTFFPENMKRQAPILSYPSCDFANQDIGHSTLKSKIPSHSASAGALPSSSSPMITNTSPGATTNQIPLEGQVKLKGGSEENEMQNQSLQQKRAKYQSIISLHQKETPCETTMIPYLSELCSREIEEDLVTTKRFIDMVGRDDDFVESATLTETVVNDSGGIKGTSSSTGHIVVVAKEAVEDKAKHTRGKSFSLDRQTAQPAKPLKMFFRNLFHGKANTVAPK